MKTFRTTTGPLPERPYYEPEEIERICADELRGVDLYPPKPAPIRIERFVEKRFGIHPSYDELPEGVLGFTRFGGRGVEAISVSRTLSEEKTQVAERRINSTLAHEAGHGLLHAHLFALSAQPQTLFGEDLDQLRRVLCRFGAIAGTEGHTGKGYDGRWWEFQANRAIGALLMPKLLVEDALRDILAVRGIFGRRVLEASRRLEAIRVLAELFDVNPVVAKIRVGELYAEGEDAQLTL